MKARVISYEEIEDRFRDILVELEHRTLDDELLVEQGVGLKLLLGVSVSQMKALNSRPYPEKVEHLATLEKALAAITYKLNTCTVEEVTVQIPIAYKAFGVH